MWTALKTFFIVISCILGLIGMMLFAYVVVPILVLIAVIAIIYLTVKESKP